jgi:hypothetical protein
MQKNQTFERKIITLIIINKLKCIILVDGFYSVTRTKLSTIVAIHFRDGLSFTGKELLLS